MNVQRLKSPDGAEMVVLSAADYDRLLALAEGARDVVDAQAELDRLAAGEGTMPDAVLGRILEGEHPVAAWRKFRGLTQVQLAEAAGLTAVYVSRIERGAAEGTGKTRRALARALDAPAWALEAQGG